MDTSVYQAIRQKIEVVLSGQEVTFQTTVPHKDGGERYVHATYLPHLSALREVKGFVAQVIDITGHKRAEEALREREAKNQALLDAIPDLMFLIDKHGTYLDFKAARDIELWMPPSEFLGKTVYEVLSSGVAERTMHYLQRALETGEIQNFEYQLLMQGNMRHYEARVVAKKEDQVLAIVRDITERKRTENVLGESEERLRQSQRMEALGRLTGGVAHDFNNLLTAITGYSELLLSGLSQGDAMGTGLEEIKKAGERATSLTRQLLTFSRGQVLQPRVLELNAVVTDVERMLRRLIGEDIDLVTVVDPAAGRVKADGYYVAVPMTGKEGFVSA